MQATDQSAVATAPNSQSHYTAIAIILHWSVSICFLTALTLGIIKNYAAKSMIGTLMFYHKSLGLTVLFLMILRLIWRITHKPPAYPQAMKNWMKRAAHHVHLSLYFLAFAMPLSGLIMSSAHGKASSFWGLFTIQLPIHSKAVGGYANSTHYYVAWIVGGFIAVHILAVIKHQFFDKDNILARMTSFKGN